jgi:hypothetical protein
MAGNQNSRDTKVNFNESFETLKLTLHLHHLAEWRAWFGLGFGFGFQNLV